MIETEGPCPSLCKCWACFWLAGTSPSNINGLGRIRGTRPQTMVCITVMFHSAGMRFIKRCIIYETCWDKRCCRSAKPCFKLPVLRAHEDWKRSEGYRHWRHAKLCSAQSTGQSRWCRQLLTVLCLMHFVVGKSEFPKNYFFKGRMTPLTRYYKFSISWIETKNSVWHCYVITLIWLKMSFLLRVILLSFLPFLLFFFFFWMFNTSISCPALNWEHSRQSQKKNNLFLARLVVHFCCHIHSCLACDMRPCSLALCCILATHLSISPSCFFERAEQ